MKNKKSLLDFFRLLSGPRLAFLVLALVGGRFLWTEHREHLLASLPYLFLLICPLMHVFMHGGHHHGNGGNSEDNPEDR